MLLLDALSREVTCMVAMITVHVRLAWEHQSKQSRRSMERKAAE